MNKRDFWIDETLNALEDIRRASPSNLTEEEILLHRKNATAQASWFRSPIVWQAAAAILVLLVLNFYTVFTTFVPANSGPDAELATTSLDYLTPINF